MRFYTARRLALAAVLPVLFTFTIIPGCSEESEGERCGDTTGPNNSDCQSGLVCIQIDSSPTYRCCNPTRVTNSRCVPAPVSAGGEAGSAGETGSASDAGSTGESGGASGVSGAPPGVASSGAGGASGATGGASSGAAGASSGDTSTTESGAGGN